MLIFKKVTWKNFLSTGNAESEVELNKHPSTLIVGKNGEGKSTMLDALTFVLFGKPFRDISKNQLINSINRKNCLVTIEFELNGHQYRVVRGIKPNVFEIYCDGNLLNQDAALKDYQKVLEQQILRLNYKTFTQVVILGSSSFVPFMQLPMGQRREVIEDILDIAVFSTMNGILKEKMVETKDELTKVETSIKVLTEKARAQQKLLQTLQDAKHQNIKTITDKIEANKKEIEAKLETISGLDARAAELHAKLPDASELERNKSLLDRNFAKFDSKIGQLDEQLEFFNSNETCPSCAQGISHDHKQEIQNKLLTEKETNLSNIATLKSAQDKLLEQMKVMTEVSKQLADIRISVSTENSAIAMLTKLNTELEAEIQGHNVAGDIEIEKERLKDIATEAVGLGEIKSNLLNERGLQDIASTLLKDTGIKTAIIREYLPIMNKLINKYLAAMDFFVHFELDESFNEIIKSRYRDEFTYASFSEGEKMRIDLAILFTWRQIAKMKNSVNTNLLILDEIFDSSLDNAGTDYFLTIMNQFGEKSNVFVISHKGDQLLDKFHNTIRFEKKNDFSMISEK